MHTLMARAKIEAISAAVEHALAVDPATRKDCEALLGKARKLATKRNEAAHSTWMIEMTSIVDTRDGSETFEAGGNVVAPHPLGRKKGPGSSAEQIEANANAFSALSLQVYDMAGRLDPRGRLVPSPWSDQR